MNHLSKSTASKKHLRVLITTGDPDGIGWEVTVKALRKVGPKSGVQFFVFRPTHARNPKLGGLFRRRVVKNLVQALEEPFSSGTLVEIHSSLPPAVWVEEGARACLRGGFQALVTAPLSKTSIVKAGFKDIGHTEILARVCGVKDSLFMGFVGDKFSVLLATGHQPLKTAVSAFTPKVLRQALSAAQELQRTLSPSRRAKPMGLVGMNPHAGESGLMGQEELWMKRFLTKKIHGPLVPDTAFLPKNWARYSVFVCPYHDQGLIPFKLVHGFSGGVHMTLGLPFVRTSVDHGTAKDLFGKNKAESGSMQEALTTAIRLAKEN